MRFYLIPLGFISTRWSRYSWLPSQCPFPVLFGAVPKHNNFLQFPKSSWCPWDTFVIQETNAEVFWESLGVLARYLGVPKDGGSFSKGGSTFQDRFCTAVHNRNTNSPCGFQQHNLQPPTPSVSRFQVQGIHPTSSLPETK